MSDTLDNGHRFRTFNVIDDYNREALAIEIDLSLPAPRVLRVLDRLVERRGYPKQLRSDNGPEFISGQLAEWAETNRIHLEFIKPGKPTQNSYVERFNRTYREEILDAYIFQSRDEVRRVTRTWIDEYNGEKPHKALGRITPLDYRRANSPEGAELSPAQKAG